jgi:hypothetical protein
VWCAPGTHCLLCSGSPRAHGAAISFPSSNAICRFRPRAPPPGQLPWQPYGRFPHPSRRSRPGFAICSAFLPCWPIGWSCHLRRPDFGHDKSASQGPKLGGPSRRSAPRSRDSMILEGCGLDAATLPHRASPQAIVDLGCCQAGSSPTGWRTPSAARPVERSRKAACRTRPPSTRRTHPPGRCSAAVTARRETFLIWRPFPGAH